MRICLPRLLLILTCAAALGACQSPGTPSSSDLEGTEWFLATLNGHPAAAGTRVTLAFKDQKVSGYSGCNWYGSEGYSVQGGKLSFGMAVMTQRACLDQTIMDQEDAYHKVLRQGGRYLVSDGQLELAASDGGTLVFTSRKVSTVEPAALAGSAWELVTMDGRPPAAGSHITLSFTGAAISGDAGCRNYKGSYEATGDHIRFPYLEMLDTHPSCDLGGPLGIQEGNYTNHLSEAAYYRLMDGRLEIETFAGAIVAFRRMGE